MSITVIIIIITAIVSLIAFNSRKIMDDIIFYPAAIEQRGEYYRFLSYGFIHADFMHLIFNMYAFYLFGEMTENYFDQIFGASGMTFYLSLYLLSLIVCVIPDYVKYKRAGHYRSLGASGAVSAVVFSYILFQPLQGIGLLFIPVFIPGFLFGILFLVISYFLGKKGGTINHSAHIWGAIFGVVFTFIAAGLFSDFPLWDHFIESVKGMELKNIFMTR